MSLDRTKAPVFTAVDHVDIPQAERNVLANGLPVWTLNAGTQDVVKIEFQFAAGTAVQPQPLVASAVNDMMDEGTATRTANAIAEELDFYGAFIESETNIDQASFTLFSLNKHLERTLGIVQEVLQQPVFPEKEFGIYVANKKQKFLVDSEKVGVLARRGFSALLYGEGHAYGGKATADDFDKLHTGLLKDFHAKNYTLANCSVIISGKVSDMHLRLLEKMFSGNAGTSNAVNTIAPPQTNAQREHLILKKDAIQSAIRMGRPLFAKNHPDWIGMQVLNTVFGGYFASRLNANIREDKGYTYGIGSAMVPLHQHGYFVIATEVGADVCAAALNEIYTEMERLQQDLIPEEEMSLVRNHLSGSLLRSTDGPFALADRLKGVINYGLGYDYYDRYLQTIKTITPETLRDLARKYLNKSDMIELVAGKK
jgi:predicted Zn-dependent peptidase